MNSAIAKELKAAKSLNEGIEKLLFLGSGGSGKSTFFRQMQILHGANLGFTMKQRYFYHTDICAQVIQQVIRMIESVEVMDEQLSVHNSVLELSEHVSESVDFILSLNSRQMITREIASHIENLWHEDMMKAVFENRARFQIDDSIAYFLDNIHRIAEEDYLPTEEDIINVRTRTTAIVSEKFIVQGTTLQMFDVGGQKSQRKKWIHCFEGVRSVIFVMSLSCYDEVLFEDTDTNAMYDSITLFEEICNCRWFHKTDVILFLNKNDLFIEKIMHVPLSDCFPDFDQNPDLSYYETTKGYQECIEYIRTRFLQQNNNPDRQIFSHVTTATDKRLVNKVFNDVQRSIVNLIYSRM
jgi:energy-coupling factor transporter ATP-binding protein EcfA2